MAKWKLLRREIVREAQTPDEITFAVDVVELPSGKALKYVHVLAPHDVVFIVAVNRRRQVAMLHQYRYLLDRSLWEIPAGSPDAGESIETGAQRELAEEAGVTADRWEHLLDFYSSVGITNQLNHVFLATGLRASQSNPSESESFSVHWLPLSEVVSMVHAGDILNGGTVIGILAAAERLSNDALEPSEGDV